MQESLQECMEMSQKRKTKCIKVEGDYFKAKICSFLLCTYNNCPPSFQDFEKIQIFQAVTRNIWVKPEIFGQQYEKFGQSQEFYSSVNDQLQKIQ